LDDSLVRFAHRVKELDKRGTGEDSHDFEEKFKKYLCQTLLAFRLAKSIPQVDESELRSKMVRFPDLPELSGRKTVIFDLDETLVHCFEEITPQTRPHVILPVVFPTGEVVRAAINVRPYALDCLAVAAEIFEVVVFTASHQSYADAVLDYLDPLNKLIHHRLYRDS
jgi:CTD small phosphatase-like protein 2